MTVTTAQSGGARQKKAAKGGKTKSSTGLSAKCGLTMNCGRILRYLKGQSVKTRVSPTAAVAMAAILEDIMKSVANRAIWSATELNKDSSVKHISRIGNRHVQAAITAGAFEGQRGLENWDLASIFDGIDIAGGGVLPNINEALLPKKKPKAEKSAKKSAKKSATKKSAKKSATKAKK